MAYLQCEWGRWVIENKHSTEIGAWLTFRATAHTDAWKRRRRFNVGRVLVLNNPPASPSVGAASGTSLSSM